MTTDGGTQQFATVFRGFDPAQVEAALAAARKSAATAREESVRSHGKVTAAESELDNLRQRLVETERERESLRQRLADADVKAGDAQAKLDEQIAQAGGAGASTFVHLGKRVGQILSLAEAEAASVLTKAGHDADRIRQDATDEAESLRRGVAQYAAETRERADTDAAQTMIEAKENAATLVDDAIRDAAARREEAEAYYERQRAHASAAAADFEHTLGQRREHAAREFQSQVAAQEEELRRLQERNTALRTEGEQERANAAEEAGQRLSDAKEHAQEMLESARAHAERIRRESERELAAAIARRDSITSQLSNVRTMLATFGVGVGVGDELLTGGDLPDELLDEVAEVAEIAEVQGGRGLGEIGQEDAGDLAHGDVTEAVAEQGEAAEAAVEAATDQDSPDEVAVEDAEREPAGRP